MTNMALDHHSDLILQRLTFKTLISFQESITWGSTITSLFVFSNEVTTTVIALQLTKMGKRQAQNATDS